MLIAWVRQNLECIHCVTWYINNIPSNLFLPTPRCCKNFHEWYSWWNQSPFHLMQIFKMVWYFWKIHSISSRTWGNFFCFKWLKNVLQINFFPSLCFISDTHASKAGQSGRLLLRRITTLCRYHNWSHMQDLCTGPFSTSLWKFFIRSSSDICLFRSDFFLFVSHCCSFCLYSGFILAIFMRILLHSRSFFM